MYIEFVSKGVAERTTPKSKMALISIREPNESVNLKAGWEHVLPVECHDTEPDTGRARVTYPTDKPLKAFDETQASDIIKFIQGLPENTNSIIVHCYGGISRSAAVAKFLCDHVYHLDTFSSYNLHNRHIYSTLLKVWNEAQKDG